MRYLSSLLNWDTPVLPSDSNLNADSLVVIEFLDESLDNFYQDMLSRRGTYVEPTTISVPESEPTYEADSLADDSEYIVDDSTDTATDNAEDDVPEVVIPDIDDFNDEVLDENDVIDPSSSTWTPSVNSEILGPILTGPTAIPFSGVYPRIFIGLMLGNAEIDNPDAKFNKLIADQLQDDTHFFSNFNEWFNSNEDINLGGVLLGDAKTYYKNKYPIHRSFCLTSFVSEAITPKCGLEAVFSTLDGKDTTNIASLDGCIGLVSTINSPIFSSQSHYDNDLLREGDSYYRQYVPGTYGTGLSRWNVSNVKNFYRAFRGCKLWWAYNPDTDAIENPWKFIDNWDFTNATSIANMFARSNCRGISLYDKNFPNLLRAAGLLQDSVGERFSFKLAPKVSPTNTPKLQYIGSMFEGTRINQQFIEESNYCDVDVLENWDVSNVTNAPRLFSFKFTKDPQITLEEIDNATDFKNDKLRGLVGKYNTLIRENEYLTEEPDPFPDVIHFCKPSSMELQQRIINNISNWEITKFESVEGMFSGWDGYMLDWTPLDKWSNLPGFDASRLAGIFNGIVYPFTRESAPSWYNKEIHGNRFDPSTESHSSTKLEKFDQKLATLGYYKGEYAQLGGEDYIDCFLGYVIPGGSVIAGNYHTGDDYSYCYMYSFGNSKFNRIIKTLLGHNKDSFRENILNFNIQEDTDNARNLWDSLANASDDDERLNTMLKIGEIVNRHYYEIKPRIKGYAKSLGKNPGKKEWAKFERELRKKGFQGKLAPLSGGYSEYKPDYLPEFSENQIVITDSNRNPYVIDVYQNSDSPLDGYALIGLGNYDSYQNEDPTGLTDMSLSSEGLVSCNSEISLIDAGSSVKGVYVLLPESCEIKSFSLTIHNFTEKKMNYGLSFKNYENDTHRYPWTVGTIDYSFGKYEMLTGMLDVSSSSVLEEGSDGIRWDVYGESSAGNFDFLLVINGNGEDSYSGYPYKKYSSDTKGMVYPSLKYKSYSPWSSYGNYVTVVKFEGLVKPIYMDYWFHKFSGLNDIDLQNLDMSDCLSLNYTFYDCSSIDDQLKNLDVSNVKSARSCLNRVGSYRGLIDITNWKLGDGCDCYGLFGSDNRMIICDNSWDGIENYERAFYECSHLYSPTTKKLKESAGTDSSNMANPVNGYFTLSKDINLDLGSEVINFTRNYTYPPYNSAETDQPRMDELSSVYSEFFKVIFDSYNEETGDSVSLGALSTDYFWNDSLEDVLSNVRSFYDDTYDCMYYYLASEKILNILLFIRDKLWPAIISCVNDENDVRNTRLDWDWLLNMGNYHNIKNLLGI